MFTANLYILKFTSAI